MAILITNEELAALLGTESVLVNKGVPNRRNNRRRSERIRPQLRIALAESTPTRSLRDLISNEEITALLTLFPVENKESMFVKVRKIKTQKRSQAEISQR